MPRYYSEVTDENDLGGNIQFRSLLAIGRTFPSGAKLSLAVPHKSNVGLDDRNPDLNSILLILLRWHTAF